MGPFGCFGHMDGRKLAVFRFSVNEETRNEPSRYDHHQSGLIVVTETSLVEEDGRGAEFFESAASII